MRTQITRMIFLIMGVLILFCQDAKSQTWQNIVMNFPPNDSLLSNSSIAFSTKNTGWILTSGTVDIDFPPVHYATKIFKTIDGGRNWSLQYVDSSYGAGSIFTIDSLHCWAGELFTVDGGVTWDTVGEYGFGKMFFFNETTGIALTEERPWFTSDGGTTWESGNSSLIKLRASDITFATNELGWIVSDHSPFATDAGYIAHTSDGGDSWTYQDSITAIMLSVDFIDTLYGFATGTNWNGSTGFVYTTTNSGKNWAWTQFVASGAFYDIGFLDNKYGWIVGNNKIIRTCNGGETWDIQEERFQSLFRTLIVLKADKAAYVFGDNNYQPPFTLLFADLNDLLPVNSDKELIPDDFQLLQNYPNPFNPVTTINYHVPVREHVTISVHDILGREIVKLANEVKNPGVYNIKWNATNSANGVYFCRMASGAFVDTKKMLLIR